MTFADPAFPSSAVFDTISQSFFDELIMKDAIKAGGESIFAFTLTNTSGAQESWYIALNKSTAWVGKGTAPEGKQPDATLLLKDEDFAKLLSGEVPAQRLFMSGGMKVRGDIMKATKAEVVLKNVRQSMEAPKAKL